MPKQAEEKEEAEAEPPAPEVSDANALSIEFQLPDDSRSLKAFVKRPLGVELKTNQSHQVVIKNATGHAEELGVQPGWVLVGFNGEDVQDKGLDYIRSLLKNSGVATQKPQNSDGKPPMPSMKMSQIAPMVVMLGMNKVDLVEMGYQRHTEAAYVCVQLICFAIMILIYQKIQDMPEGGTKIKVPEEKSMGQVVSPTKEVDPKTYDKGKFMEQVKQSGMGFVILSGVYYKWGYLMPLVLQILMTPMQLYESPLFQLHLLGKTDTTRPFPTANPFGLPAAPEAPAAPAVEEEKNEDREEEKKDK